MEKNIEKTRIIFRKWKGKNGGDVIALFPKIDQGPGCCLSYMHVGQHGGADYSLVINLTIPAKKEEYENLEKELSEIGYNLNVKHKR